MANKSRPKKTRGVFYKKYVYGVNEVQQEIMDTPFVIQSCKHQPENWMYLPYELILKILLMTDQNFCLNHLLLCRSIYWDLLKLKYKFPNLTSGNLAGFLDTISGETAACVGTDDGGIIGSGMEGNKSLDKSLDQVVDESADKDDSTWEELQEELLDRKEKSKAKYKDLKKKAKKQLPKKKKKNNDEIEVESILQTNETEKKFNPKMYIRKKFTGYVNTLDLSAVVQSGKNSFVSKLLRRTGQSLEVFISSQSSFGAAPLVSLRTCTKLKVLDLRLVSESFDITELFKSIEQLHELEQLCFPRSSVTCDSFDFNWPPNLWYLRLQGGISDDFAKNVILPDSVTHLELAHCPHLTSAGLDQILIKIGVNLTKLSLCYPLPNIGSDGADRTFWYCPNLKSFTVDVAYISWELFCEDLLVALEDYPRPLKHLRIESTGYMGLCDKVTPNDITVAVDENRLPMLKIVELNAMLGWDFKGTEMEDMVSELSFHGIDVFKV
ncbi:Pfu1 protein [Martiniozyma asiatica (nom. inval.)]|nr:Pfu1 protein [Martiniozyma asiatica]